MAFIPDSQQRTTGFTTVIGANDIWNLAINGRAAIPVVMEAVSPQMGARKGELATGTGTPYGIYYYDYRRVLSGSFYILGSTVAAAAGRYAVGSAPLLLPGNTMQFSLYNTRDNSFPELTSRIFYCDNASQMRAFGERQMVSFSATSYELI